MLFITSSYKQRGLVPRSSSTERPWGKRLEFAVLPDHIYRKRALVVCHSHHMQWCRMVATAVCKQAAQLLIPSNHLKFLQKCGNLDLNSCLEKNNQYKLKRKGQI